MNLRYFGIAAAVMLMLGWQAMADDAQRRVDALKLKQFQRAVELIDTHAEELTTVLDAQFQKFVDDALAGRAVDEQSYFEPIDALAAPIVAEFNEQLNANKVNMLRNTFPRQDEAFVEEANRAIAAREALWTEVVQTVSQYYAAEATDEDGEPGLTLAVFQGSANKMAAKIVRDGNLLKQINLDKDRLEDFLTDSSRKIWTHVKKKRSRPYLPLTRKAEMQKLLRTYFEPGRYFDAELQLKRLTDRYGKKDRDSALHLLYAFVLLINESNPSATERGYQELERAFDKLQTERLAYNLVRVGARLNRTDEETMWKLIDHAQYREDVNGLNNLYNLAMLQFIQNDDYAQATKLYETLRKRGIANRLAPSFVFVTLLKSGEFGRIAKEVRANSVTDLLAAK